MNRAEWVQALRIARREMRVGVRGFGVFLGCLFLGVFALAAVGSFSEAARRGLLGDARALLGGDLEVRLVHRELSGEQRDFLAARGRLGAVAEMRAMARAPGEEGDRVLVELKAVDKAYPLYGTLRIEPQQPLAEAFALRDGTYGVLAEEGLLRRLGISVGEKLGLGSARYEVRGVLRSEPDRTVRAFNLGPRLMVSAAGLEASGLVTPGSLVRYNYRLKLPPEKSAETVAAQLEERFPDAGWRIRTYQEAAPRVRRFLERMRVNLTLVGLCALMIGGLGVAGGVRGYLDGKVMNIAAMKCLGAPSPLIFTAYLLQILVLGTCGAALGLAAGAAVPYLVQMAAGAALPVPLAPGLFAGPLLAAGGFGLLIALAFSLRALGAARRVPPAMLFRGYGSLQGLRPGRGITLAVALTALALIALTLLVSGDRRLAFWFIGGAGGCFLIFRLLATALIALAGRLPRPSIPSLRLGLTNIHRPGAPAGSAVFSIGLGLTALVTVALVEANLEALVSESIPAEAPAFFFIDIQPAQVAAFDRVVEDMAQVEKVERLPTLRGRITAIDGVPVDEAQIDPEVSWAVRGDRYLTYAARTPEDAQIVAGSWWPPDYQGPPKLSLTADLARGFGVEIGDSLTVNVLGRSMRAEIASLREVDWSSLELNFALIFDPQTLSRAPHTWLAAAHLPPAAETELLHRVTDALPNVSAIGVREVMGNVARTLERIGGAFRAMAAVALVTGFLVLAGAVSADQHRRLHDAVIFKVCGATRRDVVAAFAAEFLFLGLAAAAVSALTGVAAAWGVVTGIMEADFVLRPWAVAGVLAAGLTLTVLLGLAGTWRALGRRPADYLREP